MQTTGIGKQEQWARFMQLSNAARTRNHGLSAAGGGVRTAATATVRPAAPVTTGRVVVRQVQTAPVITRNYAPQQMREPARILGGKFDAYA